VGIGEIGWWLLKTSSALNLNIAAFQQTMKLIDCIAYKKVFVDYNMDSNATIKYRELNKFSNRRAKQLQSFR